MCTLSRLIGFSITSVVLVGVVYVWHWGLWRQLSEVDVLKKCVVNIESGDLIFRRTQTIEGEIALVLGGGNYSHVGIASVEDKGVFIIHVVPSFPSLVRKEKMLKFISDGVAFAVYRVQTSRERRQRATSLAKAWVGKKSFDRNFNLQDDTNLYCTELVYDAYKSVEIDLVDGRYDTTLLPIIGQKKVIYPRNIIDTGHVKLICKHFINKHVDYTNVWRLTMKKKILLILASVFLVLFLAGCSSGPDGAVKAFFKALDAGKVDEATGYLSASTLGTLGHDKWQAAWVSAATEMQSKGGLSSVDVVDKKVHGDVATIIVKLTFGDGSSETNTMNLLKENGDWKIQMMP